MKTDSTEYSSAGTNSTCQLHLLTDPQTVQAGQMKEVVEIENYGNDRETSVQQLGEEFWYYT